MGTSTIENGPLPVDRIATLWRYVSLPTLLLYLDGRLRLSSINRLRGLDPLEGSRYWDHVTQTAALQGNEYVELFEYVRDHELTPADKKLLDANSDHPDTNQRKIFDHWHRLVTSTRYALCFFRSDHQSIAMWRLYAPQGFAIRTNLNSLERGLSGTKKEWRISKMKYIDASKEVSPDAVFRDKELKEALRRPFFLKGREYSYENEVRLVTVDPKEMPSIEVDSVSATDWIEEIIISPELWGKDSDILKHLINSKFRGLVRQSSALCGPISEDSDWEKVEGEIRERNAEEHWPKLLRKP